MNNFVMYIRRRKEWNKFTIQVQFQMRQLEKNYKRHILWHIQVLTWKLPVFVLLRRCPPNPDRHVQVHAHILARAINSYGDTGTQSLLDLQKGYVDMFYDWKTRINQWTAFLTSLKENLEAAKI